MTKIHAIISQQDDEINSMVEAFTERLKVMVEKAMDIVSEGLRGELTTVGGVVETTVANQKVLNSIERRFNEAMDSQGYQQHLDQYVASFNGQFAVFDQIIASIDDGLVYGLPPVKFSRSQMAQFTAAQLGARDLLEGVVKSVAGRMQQRATISVGGMNVKQLTSYLAKTSDLSIAESANIAETSVSTFYRTITDKGYRMIEEDLPGFKIRYTYEGPLDKLTRPFCTKLERLALAGKSWTRAEINKMTNNQLPNVFATGGGYRCRHQWVISVSDLAAQQARKPRPDAPKRRTSRQDIQDEIAARREVQARSTRSKVAAAAQPVGRAQSLRQSVRDTVAALRRAREVRNV